MVDYGTGAIGAGERSLLTNQGGSAGLDVTWLWYFTESGQIYMTFTPAFDSSGLALYAD